VAAVVKDAIRFWAPAASRSGADGHGGLSVNNATAVGTNNTIINATFSEPMSPITGSASFVLTCSAMRQSDLEP
jgi:hypothetical protein